MDTEQILRLMQNAGFRVHGADAQFIYIEDPACVLRAFATFAEYAWLAVVGATGLLLFGWAISMIRGAKNDIFTNLRNLILILGIVSAAGPIINVIFGDDLFRRGCSTAEISIADVQEMLAARNTRLARQSDDLYEEFDIYDTGVIAAPDNAPASNEEAESTVNTPEQNSVASHPIRAHESGRDVVYTYTNQSQTRRSSGTRAWRNNNPGNLAYGQFARAKGAIGKGGKFAVFPDYETGRKALEDLLLSDSYKNMTIASAIIKYAPPYENDVERYKRQLRRLTGVALDKKLCDLDSAEMKKITGAICVIEGWREGKIKGNTNNATMLASARTKAMMDTMQNCM